MIRSTENLTRVTHCEKKKKHTLIRKLHNSISPNFELLIERLKNLYLRNEVRGVLEAVKEGNKLEPEDVKVKYNME